MIVDPLGYRRTMSTPGWRTSVITLTDRRQFGIAEFGPADGFPILWFHGTPGGRRQVPGSAREYAEARGVRIIGVERPGVGESTPHRYDRVIDFAADARQIIDQLGLTRVGLIGLSGGGPYVLAVCSALPNQVVAAAVLGGVGPSAGPEKVSRGGIIPVLRRVSPLLPCAREPMGWLMTAGLRLVAPVADQVFNVYMAIGPKSDREFLARPEMRQMFIDDLLASGQVSFRAVAYDAVLFSRWWGFDIAGITTPVYLWHGDADLVIPLVHGERMAALIPNSRLSVVSGQGHLAMLDAAEEAIDLILTHV
jgi:pimeloyl-ACP methyl ester carboxylesterase